MFWKSCHKVLFRVKSKMPELWVYIIEKSHSNYIFSNFLQFCLNQFARLEEYRLWRNNHKINNIFLLLPHKLKYDILKFRNFDFFKEFLVFEDKCHNKYSLLDNFHNQLLILTISDVKF